MNEWTHHRLAHELHDPLTNILRQVGDAFELRSDLHDRGDETKIDGGRLHLGNQLDQAVIELIAKMQPAAVDLRYIATVMKITPELERIADLAQDVCERVMELVREPMMRPLVHLPRLAEDTQRMVRQALDAFVRGDAVLARQVIKEDDVVDQLTVDSFRALLTYMMENPRNISPAIRLT